MPAFDFQKPVGIRDLDQSWPKKYISDQGTGR